MTTSTAIAGAITWQRGLNNLPEWALATTSRALNISHQTVPSAPPPLRVEPAPYRIYLELGGLFSQQHPFTEKPAEQLFIMLHQMQELLFSGVLTLLYNSFAAMPAGNLVQAAHYLTWAKTLMNIAIQSMDGLKEMTKEEFGEFRGHFKGASGLQSVQFYEVELALGIKSQQGFSVFRQDLAAHNLLLRRSYSPNLTTVLYDLLRKRGCPIPEKMDLKEQLPDRDPIDSESWAAAWKGMKLFFTTHDEELSLAQACLGLEESLLNWRTAHILLVTALIGYQPGTGGTSGHDFLHKNLEKRALKLLREAVG